MLLASRRPCWPTLCGTGVVTAGARPPQPPPAPSRVRTLSREPSRATRKKRTRTRALPPTFFPFVSTTTMSSGQPHISRRDPETVFELIKQIGSGSYGSVQKVRRCVGVKRRGGGARNAERGKRTLLLSSSLLSFSSPSSFPCSFFSLSLPGRSMFAAFSLERGRCARTAAAAVPLPPQRPRAVLLTNTTRPSSQLSPSFAPSAPFSLPFSACFSFSRPSARRTARSLP